MSFLGEIRQREKIERGKGKGIKAGVNSLKVPIDIQSHLSSWTHSQPTVFDMPSLKSLFVLGVAALSAFAFPAPAAENALAARSDAFAVAPAVARSFEPAAFRKLINIISHSCMLTV
jgi:hypothetical protein